MKEISFGVSFKFTSHFNISGGYATNRLDFLGSGFRTHQVSSRFVYAFSSRVNLQVFTQWNNDSRVADVYIRLHIIPKIGSDIYGVLNQLVDTEGSRGRSAIGRAARAKIVYPFYH